MAVPVRFFVHLLPVSAAPDWLGWPLAAPPTCTYPEATQPVGVDSTAPSRPARVAGASTPPPRGNTLRPAGWYAWRLMSTNNRELARSAFRFPAVELCWQAAWAVQAGVGRIVLSTLADPSTGAFSWHAELDGTPVAVGKRYEQEQNARQAAMRFLDVVARAQVSSAVRALRVRRGPAAPWHPVEGAP